MIEFTRRIAKEVRAVFKKVLGRHYDALLLVSGPDGLRIQAQGYEHAVEFHEPAPREEVELLVPSGLLDEVQGERNDAVVVTALKKSLVAATWEVHGVAHRMQYHRPKGKQAPFPAAPSALSDAPPAFIEALHHAYEMTDPTSSRHALSCIQLRGQAGQIAATDGRQLLLQSDFALGFEDEVLVQNTPVFGCKQLPRDRPVHIGRTEEHFVIRVGPWTFYLGLNKEGRFPCTEHVIPDPQSSQTTLELNGADAEFYLENIQRLPGGPEDSSITLDLGDRVAIRAMACDTPAPTELVLCNSHKSGADAIVRMDRRYFARAVAMGFRRIHTFGVEQAMLARDNSRQYLWMPLSGNGAIAASDDCLRIESLRVARPDAEDSPTPTFHSVPMSTSTTVEPAAAVPVADAVGKPQPSRRTRRAARTVNTSPLEHALALREQLRTALATTKGLIQAVKAEKRGQKSLQLALNSLKQLQAVA